VQTNNSRARLSALDASEIRVKPLSAVNNNHSLKTVLWQELCWWRRLCFF